MKPVDHRIYLASKSPRRRELLRQIGVDFELLLPRDQNPRGPDISEDVLPGEAAKDYVERVTRAKAEHAKNTMLWRKLPLRVILAADTTVVLDNEILGKPSDPAAARNMLKSLSSRTHQVMTSVAVHSIDQEWQITQTSNVTFTSLSDHVIDKYCATSEPYDKAGGYAIQGIAAFFVQNIIGSYSGIMGLPLFETAQLLQQAGIKIL